MSATQERGIVEAIDVVKHIRRQQKRLLELEREIVALARETAREMRSLLP